MANLDENYQYLKTLVPGDFATCKANLGWPRQKCCEEGVKGAKDAGYDHPGLNSEGYCSGRYCARHWSMLDKQDDPRK